MDAFARDRNLGEECGPLAAELLQAGVADTDLIRRRMWRALEVRDWRSVQTLAELLGGDPKAVTRALKKSTKVLREFEAMSDKPRKRLSPQRADQLLIALVRVARARPVDAAEWMPALGSKLRLIERQYLWAQIAASAMRDMIPEAYAYTVKATGAPITDITRQWLARAALRQQDWRLLTRIIGQMESKTQSYSTWIYWRARAMMAMNERYGAQALLKKIAGQHHFYGQLAAEELGDLVASPASAPKPDAKTIRRLGNQVGFKRARKFYEVGVRYQGNREWNYQARGMNDNQKLAVAHHACQNDLLERCISMAERTREQHDFGLRFISPFRQALAPVAARHGLDLSWIYGLIRQESRFTPDARSVSGARGLMQIMPATGRWIARKMGVKGFKTKHLYQPDTNLNFGTFYLKAVYDDLHNSALLASAAYNAGPKRPRRWISTLPGDVDGALFVEIIPFTQTRTYVKKVLLNTAYYESVFSGKPQSLKSLLGQVPQKPYQATKIP
jgi:soluble lytic murein transglycosylase